MYENRDNRIVVTRGGLSLGTIGLITWIVFMILGYGVKVPWLQGANQFWIWFPLWAPIALWLALVIIITVIVLIIALIAAALDK